MVSNIFYFGIWTVPFSVLIAISYCYISVKLRSLFEFGISSNKLVDLCSFDFILIFIIIFFPIFFVHFKNREKRRYGINDFNPFKMNVINALTIDKAKAMYHEIPSVYLSKVPIEFTLGKKGNSYVYLPFLSSPEHQLILGSPGSGKTTSILNALIFIHNFQEDKKIGAVLAIDSKPELTLKSVDELSPFVKIINPSSSDYDKYYGFDVFYGLNQLSTDDELKERTDMIARSLIPSLSGDNEHFSGNAQKILSGFLMFGFRKGLSFTDTIVKVMHVSTEDLISEIICDNEMKKHPKIVGKVKSFDGNSSDEFASIKDTLHKNLDIFDTETVKKCFSSNRKATPDDLLNGISIYLAIPDHLLTQYKTVFGLIIELCLKYLMTRKESKINEKAPVWCLIDEGGTIYVPSIEDVAARGRSKKIQLSIVAQSYSQLENLYGDRQASTILDCCKTTIVFSCNNTKTAEVLSKWCGTYQETKVSQNQNGFTGVKRKVTQNVSTEFRNVMEISDIKNLESKNEVLIFVKGDWFVCKKAPYYTIKKYNNLSKKLVEKNLKDNEGGNYND